MSLLWVAVLGFIVIYIYSLVGFALLRAYFKPNDYLYCHTLFQCTVTVIRYGLIGDMFEVSVVERFYVALFYALEQTRCARM